MDVLTSTWLVCLAGLTALYWIAPERLRAHLVPAATAALLAWLSPLTLGSLLLAVLVAWHSQRLAHNGRAVALACALQLAPLIAWRLNAQVPLPVIAQIAIPLGLAYSALRGVHYVLEAYKGALPQHRLADVGGYFLFLPTLIAGPIHRFGPWLADQRRVRWNPMLFSEGLERILYGYIKLAFIANLLITARFTGWIEASFDPGSREALYLTMIAKGLNGYFQFAGYSDVAIGFARLLGFRVMENFDSPLTKPNVQRFWGAWHMSLTSWCRDYVYTPVFSLTRGRGIGILASMAVLGLWHEFTWRYLAWGLYNGAGIVAWHQWRLLGGERLDAALATRPLLARLWYGLAVVLTVHFIFLGFVLVQHPTLTESLAVWSALLGGQ
jgi:D-alanyl-lipoteichoic acid acyltransferase DltB (MBOAT superfamily)